LRFEGLLEVLDGGHVRHVVALGCEGSITENGA
jgi:hypothetical protein